MRLRFDESKPFGIVTPPYNGAVRYQEASDGTGYYFNAANEPLNAETWEVIEVSVKAVKPEPVISTMTTVKANGEKETVEVVEQPVEEVDPRQELIKWLKADDKAETNWMKIRGYGKEVLGRVASGKDELISLALEKNLVPENQVKVA